MPNRNFEKYKKETLELDNKRRWFLVFAIVLYVAGGFLALLGGVTLAAAFDGQLHFYAAYILLTVALNCIIGGTVLLILRKVIFEKRLRERQAKIQQVIENRKKNKVHHE